MLKILLRTRMEALLSVLTGASRTKKAQSKAKLIGFAAVMLLSIGSLGILFARIFEVIAQPFRLANLGWLYFGLATVMCFGVMIIGNVILAKYQLFEARDNDLLLSMPIKPIHILLSRLFLLLVLAWVMALPIAIPCVLFWPAPLGAWGMTAFVLVFFAVLPLLNLVVSALLGWLLHLASQRARNKSLISLVATLGFLGVYMYFNFKLNSILTEVAQDPSGLEKSLGSAAPVVWMGRAVAEGRAELLALMLAIALAAFALCLWLLQRSFIQTATAKSSAAKRVYVEQTAKAASPEKALLGHELRRLWASSAYLLNGALGSFFTLAAAVYLLIKGGSLTASEEWLMLKPLLQPLIVAGLCYMASLVFLTAPSISLEGKYLWLPKSLPVSAWTVLKTKLRLHMLIALPPLVLVSVAAALTLGYEGQLKALVLILPPLFGVFSGLLGLFENLRHPNFNWINETQAVKSGASVVLTMFIGMGLVLLPILVCLFFSDWVTPELAGWGMVVLLAVLSVLLYLWLRKKGPRVFREL
jgi:ABC-2 type transport system permease protein